MSWQSCEQYRCDQQWQWARAARSLDGEGSDSAHEQYNDSNCYCFILVSVQGIIITRFSSQTTLKCALLSVCRADRVRWARREGRIVHPPPHPPSRASMFS